MSEYEAAKAKLKMLRALENLFYGLGSYFEDWADSLNTEFHDELRRAMSEPPTRGIGYIAGISERDPLVIEDD